MGNLARATYVASDWLWPWSYDHCDPALQPKQLISAATRTRTGRHGSHTAGAPEIDILEAMPGKGRPHSKVGKPYQHILQIAPGITENRPGTASGLAGSVVHGQEFGTIAPSTSSSAP